MKCVCVCMYGSIFPVTSVSGLALGSTQPSVQWVPGVLGSDLTTHPPSSAEVKNELELYLLSPQVPPWHVVGQL
jgi:hypothetical protein